MSRDRPRRWVRPDGRTVALLDHDRPLAPQVASLLADGDPRPLLVEVDEVHPERAALEALGLAVVRREDEVRIDVASALAVLTAEPVAGLRLVDVATFGLDRLRTLDERLREDVPGSDGWRWDPDDFRDETLGDHHDERLYRIALLADEAVGLVRIWQRPDRFRLGLVAVLATHRRHGIAGVLLADVLDALHERGVTSFTAEVDRTNAPVQAMLAAAGADLLATTLTLAAASDDAAP